MIIKKEIRIIGFDDGPFVKGSKGKVPVIGSIFRGGLFLDGLIRLDIDIDGTDATEKIINALEKTRHEDIRIVMLDGITFGGFNIVNIEKLYKETKLPVIVITRKKTDMKKFKQAMKKLENFEEREKCIKSVGDFYEFKSKRRGKSIYFQKIGLSEENVREIINISSTRSLIPEPVRVSHIIASGIVKGESIGRP